MTHVLLRGGDAVTDPEIELLLPLGVALVLLWLVLRTVLRRRNERKRPSDDLGE